MEIINKKSSDSSDKSDSMSEDKGYAITPPNSNHEEVFNSKFRSSDFFHCLQLHKLH